MVRAKFRCKMNDGETVQLWPVVGGSEENDNFYKYTPTGDITLTTVNTAAAAQFEVGKEYYVDFTPA